MVDDCLSRIGKVSGSRTDAGDGDGGTDTDDDGDGNGDTGDDGDHGHGLPRPRVHAGALMADGRRCLCDGCCSAHSPAKVRAPAAALYVPPPTDVLGQIHTP